MESTTIYEYLMPILSIIMTMLIVSVSAIIVIQGVMRLGSVLATRKDKRYNKIDRFSGIRSKKSDLNKGLLRLKNYFITK